MNDKGSAIISMHGMISLWLAAAGLAVGAETADLSVGIPEPPAFQYRGVKYRNDPRLTVLREAYPEMWKRAWTRVREATGLRYQDCGPGKVSIVINDSSPRDRKNYSALTTGYHGNQQIEFRSEYLFNGCVPFETTLTHELTHAVMRHCLGKKLGFAVEFLPAWVKEGVAWWVAGQEPVNVGWVLGQALDTEDPLIQKGRPLINGLEGNSKWGAIDLEESALAVAFLHKILGQEKFIQWIKALDGGIDVSKGVEQATHMSWIEFANQAREYAEERLRNELKDIHAPYASRFQKMKKSLTASGDVRSRFKSPRWTPRTACTPCPFKRPSALC